MQPLVCSDNTVRCHYVHYYVLFDKNRRNIEHFKKAPSSLFEIKHIALSISITHTLMYKSSSLKTLTLGPATQPTLLVSYHRNVSRHAAGRKSKVKVFACDMRQPIHT